MTMQTMAGGEIEMIIPAQVLRGDRTEMIAELDLLVVGLLALRRRLGGDERAPIAPWAGSALPPEQQPIKRIRWPWRRFHGPDAACAQGRQA